MLRFALLLLGLLAVQPALHPAAAQALDYCTGADTEVDYFLCMEAAFVRADARLNRVYQRALGVIERKDDLPQEMAARRADWKEALRDAQRAWIAFKDVECEALTPFENGANWDAYAPVLACRIDLTERRTDALAMRYDVAVDPTVPSNTGFPVLEARLHRLVDALRRHDAAAVVVHFEEEGYLTQRETFGLEDAQIIWETLGTAPVPGLDGRPHAERLRQIVDVRVTHVQPDDARGVTVRGLLRLLDGREVAFETYWAERATGAFDLVVPVG